jgi:hypothetical protein
MAKKEKRGKKSQGPGAGAADALRDAVERTFQGAAGGAGVAQKRAAELFDDLTQAMQRLRETIDEKRVLDTLEHLRDEVQGLATRVAALERKDVTGAASSAATGTARRATGARTTAARKPSTTRASSGTGSATARKATAARKTATARKTAAPKPAASGTAKTGTTRSSTTATKRAQTKASGTTSARKPRSTTPKKASS